MTNRVENELDARLQKARNRAECRMSVPVIPAEPTLEKTQESSIDTDLARKLAKRLVAASSGESVSHERTPPAGSSSVDDELAKKFKARADAAPMSNLERTLGEKLESS
eukprot:8708574-Pyramimonas_sp.AAC.1